MIDVSRTSTAFPVSIVIPSYNGLELLKKCLPSILAFVDFQCGHEVIVVDDGSRDESLSFLEEHFPQVRVIALKKNLGFAKASTEGILKAKNRIIGLINNDVTVYQDFLSPLIRNFADPAVFAVGPRVLKEAGGSIYHLGSKAFFSKGEITITRDREGRDESFYVSGGMMFFDKEKFWGLGGFDDLYHPFYWEDVDLCYRALKQGYRILHEPDSLIYHQDQGTIVFGKKGKTALFFAKMVARIIQERNQYLFTWKNILEPDLVTKHLLWIPLNLILSLWTKDHIFKPFGFLSALPKFKKARGRRREEQAKRYLRKDCEILSSAAPSHSPNTCWFCPAQTETGGRRQGRRGGKGGALRKLKGIPTRNTIKTIQIYGERCSGTTYLEHLLKKNLESIQIRWDFGWKHFFHGKGVEDSSDCLFIVIYRNPVVWLKSLHLNPFHAARELRGIGFSEFIRREWWCIWDEDGNKSPEDPIYGTEMMFERDPETGQRFSNVIRLRTAKVKNWESLRDKTENSIYVRYEDLSANPKAFIETLAERFGMKRTELFENIQGYKGESIKYHPKVYPPIAPEDMEYILREIDIDLERRIGYDSPMAFQQGILLSTNYSRRIL